MIPAVSLELGLFLTQPPTESVTGPEAAKMLRDYFTKASAKLAELKPAEALAKGEVRDDGHGDYVDVHQERGL